MPYTTSICINEISSVLMAAFRLRALYEQFVFGVFSMLLSLWQPVIESVDA